MRLFLIALLILSPAELSPQSLNGKAKLGGTATLNRASTAPSGTPWITFNMSGGSSFNNYTGLLGAHFVVGASPINVTHLGRLCLTGDSLTHTVYILNDDGTDNFHVTVNMAGCTPDTFVYAAATGTLSASTGYYVVSSETNGGDTVYNVDGTPNYSFTAVAILPLAAAGTLGSMANGAPGLYVPTNFKY